MLPGKLRRWVRRSARRGRGASSGLGRGGRQVRGGAGLGSVQKGVSRDADPIAWDDSGRSAHSDVHGVAGRLSDGVNEKSLYSVIPTKLHFTEENCVRNDITDRARVPERHRFYTSGQGDSEAKGISRQLLADGNSPDRNPDRRRAGHRHLPYRISLATSGPFVSRAKVPGIEQVEL